MNGLSASVIRTKLNKRDAKSIRGIIEKCVIKIANHLGTKPKVDELWKTIKKTLPTNITSQFGKFVARIKKNKITKII